MKDKLGDKSNAGCEVLVCGASLISKVEYRDAYGEMIGPDGRGVATILEMVHHTRCDINTYFFTSIRFGPDQ
jgi:putative acyl-CoA dehydrogenase